MPLFNDLSKKITATTQNVVRGTKDFTDTARFRSLIADEQKQIASLYSQIGKLYYDSNEADAETPIGKLCLAIDSATERIAKYEQDILQIRGVKNCPSCGIEVPINAAFCGGCGVRIDVAAPEKSAASPAKICTGCGAEIPEGVAFCITCGQKAE